MGNPELSISFRAESSEKVLQETAATVGKYNFDVISVYEDLGDQSPMYPLITLARQSRGARLGPACIIVPKYRTMEPIVGDIARLDSIRPGQAYLGLASGAWMEQVGLKPATVNQLREAAEVSRYLLEKRACGYVGQYYQVRPGFTLNYPTPEKRVPLLIGAYGEKMAALAGEIADEIKVGGSVNPLMVPIIKERVAVGARVVGRNPDDIGVVMGAVTVVDEDSKLAKSYARKKAVIYIDAIGHLDPTLRNSFPGEVTKIRLFVALGDLESAAEYMPDDLARKFIFAGNPDEVIRQVGELFDAGANRVEFGTPHGINGIDGINLLGTKVLPYFR